MKDDNLLEKIGEKFGSDIVELVRVNRAFTVTVLKVDDKFAYVTMTESKNEMPVPLTCTSLEFGYLKVTPKVDSLAVVTLANGMDNAPFFIAFSEVDEVMLTVGETSVRINKDVWEFNGGELGGLVLAKELKTQLDKTNEVLQQLVTIISGAPIPEPGNGSPSALQTSLAGAIAGKTLGEFSSIENEKITQ